MATRSPFSYLSGLSDPAAGPWQPPDWVVDEIQQRLLLLLNHVLAQEPEAMQRLSRVAGQTLLLRWRHFHMGLAVTRVGLLDRTMPGATPDLSLTLIEESPLTLAQAALRGQKPPVRIEGDVLLAAEVNWLVDHLRWDIEEDLARLIGDAPARAVGEVAQRALAALREFAAKPQSPSSPPSGPVAQP